MDNRGRFWHFGMLVRQLETMWLIHKYCFCVALTVLDCVTQI